MNEHDYPRMPIAGDEGQLLDKIHRALEIAWDFGAIDGAHHKMWAINQMIDALTDGHLKEFAARYEEELPNGDSYGWDEGIAP